MRRAMVGTVLLLAVVVWVPSVRADRVDDCVRAEMERQHIPGVSVAVVRNGKVAKLRGYGLANVELNVRATEHTVYQIGSMTKQFTATAIMMLEEQGKLRLDDPVSGYLADLPDAWKSITVRQLLTHTSGIKSFTEVPNYNRLSTAPAKPDEVINQVAGYPLAFAPGEKWAYSNTNYFLLGLIIEKAGGKPYPQFLKERIFAPLGMSATRVNDMGDVIRNRASGYSWTQNGLRNGGYTDAAWPFAAGALVSTAADLAKWDAALYGEALLRKSSLERMWTPVKLNSGATYPYGFGWDLNTEPGHREVSHGGGIPGFTCHLSRFLDQRLTVIVLTNAEADPDVIVRRVAGLPVLALAPPTYQPIPDTEPKVTALVTDVLDRMASGQSDPEVFTPEMRAAFFPDVVKQAGAYVRSLGAHKPIVLVERKEEGGQPAYRYRVTFRDKTLYLVCTLAQDGKISGLLLQPE